MTIIKWDNISLTTQPYTSYLKITSELEIGSTQNNNVLNDMVYDYHQNGTTFH